MEIAGAFFDSVLYNKPKIFWVTISSTEYLYSFLRYVGPKRYQKRYFLTSNLLSFCGASSILMKSFAKGN
jgi:hypothetical protein